MLLVKMDRTDVYTQIGWPGVQIFFFYWGGYSFIYERSSSTIRDGLELHWGKKKGQVVKITDALIWCWHLYFISCYFLLNRRSATGSPLRNRRKASDSGDDLNNLNALDTATAIGGNSSSSSRATTGCVGLYKRYHMCNTQVSEPLFLFFLRHDRSIVKLSTSKRKIDGKCYCCWT